MSVKQPSLSRKLRIQSKNFYLEDDTLTKEASESNEVLSPQSGSITANPTAIRLIDSFLGSADPNESILALKPRSKRASSNCGKSMIDPSDNPTSKNENYQKKYKTEICKNFQLRGHCQWGDLVS